MAKADIDGRRVGEVSLRPDGAFRGPDEPETRGRFRRLPAMSTSRPPKILRLVDYPTRDGKPVGETPIHRDILVESIQDLRPHFADDPMIYISGNMLLYYVEGDKHKHVSPDVFVVRGIPDTYRDAYFLWVEGKGPDLVIELTSRSTRKVDIERKYELYRDVLRVAEYFLFDPKAEYLKPPLQGHRLVGGQYVPIEPMNGRLPSAVLGLHLERDGHVLRFYNPATGAWIPKDREFREAYPEVQAALQQSEAERQRIEAHYQQSEEERRAAEDELQRLRQEIEALRRRTPDVS